MQIHYQSRQLQFMLKTPGQPVRLPSYILEDLKNLDPKYRRNLNFFGGHPVSITKQSLNSIFTDIRQREDGMLESQYLVCEKTDGVRYLLLICHVDQNDLVNEDDAKQFAKYGPTQCYLISREGQKGLIAYAANMKVGFGWTRKPQSSFKHVIEILDGELVIDNPVGQHPESCKFLIFDILVHLQENITKLPLINRLKESVKFMECNNFLLDNTPASKKQKQAIPLQIKDFFRLNSEKYNMVRFLLNKYINCLPHENDGLIFNHQSKMYELGVNAGYIKWKPAHLNTLDFMLIPNKNFTEKMDRRILDLYLAARDTEVEGNYVRLFYGFMVVEEEQFAEVEGMLEANKDKLEKIYEEKLENGEDFGDRGHFDGAVIAECKFQETNLEEKDFLSEIYGITKDPSEIHELVMKPFRQQDELKRIQTLQKAIYDRSWKIYKVREDKGLPNNVNVAEKIEQSIKDNILEDELVRRNDELNEKVSGRKVM